MILTLQIISNYSEEILTVTQSDNSGYLFDIYNIQGERMGLYFKTSELAENARIELIRLLKICRFHSQEHGYFGYKFYNISRCCYDHNLLLIFHRNDVFALFDYYADCKDFKAGG